jgi:hypothetical protein
MKTKITLMTVFATVLLAGAAVTAKAQCGYAPAPAPRFVPAPVFYGPAHPVAVFHDRRDIYRDEVAIRRDRYDLNQDRAYADHVDARVDRGHLYRAEETLGRDRRDLRHDRW